MINEKSRLQIQKSSRLFSFFVIKCKCQMRFNNIKMFEKVFTWIIVFGTVNSLREDYIIKDIYKKPLPIYKYIYYSVGNVKGEMCYHEDRGVVKNTKPIQYDDPRYFELPPDQWLLYRFDNNLYKSFCSDIFSKLISHFQNCFHFYFYFRKST